MNERAIFLAALAIADPAERAAYLNRACEGNPMLRQQVEALLAAHERSGEFLDVPALQQIAANAAPPADQPRVPGAQTSAEDQSGNGGIDLSFLQPSTRPGSLGRLGHYEIDEVIGRGGFGIVLKAFDEMLQRVVAIKVMAPELAATSPARKRFLREARAAAAIRHENVIAIHAVEDQPIPFLVMEYIAGQTLQQKLDETGPLEVPEILLIGQQIAEGLEAAHALGLIHRDIKPANVLLEKGRNRIKITDFGLARTADDASVTQSGTIAGTPLYMSPEQSLGEVIDPRSDLFSLGSVLYVMCSGRPPFRAPTAMAVLLRVAQDSPRPIREIIPEAPDWLVAIIARLHSKKPADRFASAKEVADLLGRCLLELQQKGRVEPLGNLLPMSPKPDTSAEKPVQDETKTSEKKGADASASRPARPRNRRWAAAAAMIGVLIAGLGLTEATGITNVRSTVIRLFSPDGTLVVEVDDPGVSVSIDGEEMTITGAGAKEIRLKPGQYKVLASKDGKVVRQELVTVSRNGRQVVRVSKEAPPVLAAGDHPKTDAPLPPRFKNSLGMEFALVPKGKAWLGGGGGKPGDKEVEFKEDFYLGVYEVTQWEWMQVTGNNPSRFKAVEGVSVEDQKRFPAEQFSWEDAQEFIARLNREVKDSGWVYRLPTAVEWEYACRGGPMNDLPESTFHYYLENPTNELKAGQACFGAKQTCKVGSYKPNRLGLFDMHGNVWEWCSDEVKGTDGAARECRGGSFGDTPYKCAAAFRNSHPTHNRFGNFGLRVARVRVAADPDRRAAEWVLSVGGNLQVLVRGQTIRELRPGAELPQEPFVLSKVVLSNLDQVTDASLANLKGCKHVSHLVLAGTSVGDVGLTHLGDCTNLQSLDLRGCGITDEGLASLSLFPSLRTLSLYGCRLLADAGMRHVGQSRALENLDLTGTAVSDQGLAELGDLLRLQYLNLERNTRITAKSKSVLARFTGLRDLRVAAAAIDADTLRRLPRLEQLVICRLADDAALQELGVVTKLKVLLLQDSSSVTGSGLTVLAKMPELHLVHLENSGIDNDALKHLALAPKLTRVNLTSLPKVTDAGLVHLQQCTGLKLVELQSPQFSDAGLKHLMPLTNLEYLAIIGKNGGITEPGLKKLAAALPKCRITWDGQVIDPASVQGSK